MEHEDFQNIVIEKLSRLQTQMETLVGNGQPGRIRLLEDDVKDLSKARWVMGGIITGVASTISAIIHFAFRH